MALNLVQSTTAKIPPGPKGDPILGNFRTIKRDGILHFMMNNARTYGDFVRIKVGPLYLYQINDIEAVYDILVGQAAKFEKTELDRAILRQSTGNGLLGIEGETHRRERKFVQPIFHSKRIESYAQIIIDYALKTVDSWRDGQVLDVHEQMAHLTMLIIAKTLYDADLSGKAGGVGEAMHELTEVGNDQFIQGFIIPPWIPVRQNRRWQSAVKRLDSLLLPVIEERRKSGEDHGDLLSMLIQAQDEDSGQRMTDRQLRDEVVTLFTAGHETTSNTLSWTLFLLAKHPEIEAKLLAELTSVLAGRTPTMADLKALPYLDFVIKESMRLYPPAWALFGRKAIETTTLKGFEIPSYARIFILPYVIHRNPAYFPDPETFRPERWANDFEKTLPRYAYFPFGGGAHVCIGNSFALLEARLILAIIVGRYHLSMAGADPEPDALITLRPKDGVTMRVMARG